MSSRTFLVSLLGIVSFCLLSGCSSSKEATEISQRVVSWDALKKKVPDATYVVDPPDAIRIEFMSPLPPPEPPVTATLRQDGVVTLPYLEDVNVADMTTIQIREKLENLYSKYYKEPKILVTVVGFNSKHIYVYGEVGRQGSIAYHGHETFSDVMGEVGGVNTRAAYWRCKVIRGDPDNPEYTMVNFRKIMLEGDRRQDVSIAENDVIRVPPTAIAWFGDRVAELLSPFSSALNVAGTVGAVRSVGTNVTGNPNNASGSGYGY
jgi:protein involved in polysaccharide export with SLBB domain